jgi:hypothetical protein
MPAPLLTRYIAGEVRGGHRYWWGAALSRFQRSHRPEGESHEPVHHPVHDQHEGSQQPRA